MKGATAGGWLEGEPSLVSVHCFAEWKTKSDQRPVQLARLSLKPTFQRSPKTPEDGDDAIEGGRLQPPVSTSAPSRLVFYANVEGYD